MEEARSVYVWLVSGWWWLVHELSGSRGAVECASGGFIPYRSYLISRACCCGIERYDIPVVPRGTLRTCLCSLYCRYRRHFPAVVIRPGRTLLNSANLHQRPGPHAASLPLRNVSSAK